MTTAAALFSTAGADQKASGVVIHQYPVTRGGLLVRRYKRFLADVVFVEPEPCGSSAGRALGIGNSEGARREHENGAAEVGPSVTVVADTGHGSGDGNSGSAAGALTCHCPNTGPMVGLLNWPMAPVVCSVSTAPGRKYSHTLEMIQPSPGGAWVGVHSALANRLVQELLDRRLLPQLGEWREVTREVPYGSRGSRVDFVLTRPTGRRVFIEVKSVTLAEPYRAHNVGVITATSGLDPGPDQTSVRPNPSAVTAAPVAGGPSPTPPRNIALFPDTVSERAQRHVEDLMEVLAQGSEAVCLFVIQRDDCDLFAPCAAKDPKYAKLVRQAVSAGVQVLALRTSLRPAAATAHHDKEDSRGKAEGDAVPHCAAASDVGGAGRGADALASVVYLGPAQLELEYGSTDDDDSANLTVAMKKQSRNSSSSSRRCNEGASGTSSRKRSKPKP
ncbi:hypothetical protein Vretifemale_20243 [Volvox reticuliferus]|nr:hypothetical protein Vretifemale_20243 [Volvox reticuliferus]